MKELNDFPFLGKSRFAKKLREDTPKLAPLNATVLVTGETGTGKSIVTALLHGARVGRHEVFDCTTNPTELFESRLFGSRKGAFTGAIDIEGSVSLAKNGTLHVEEIGELPFNTQQKFLRLLDGFWRPLGAKVDQSLNARVVVTTNRDLEQLVADGKFREDLFYRLSRTRIHIPPLRERAGDVQPLLEHYIRQCELNKDGKVSFQVDDPDDLIFLMKYPWPGNVRQLQDVVWQTLFQFSGQTIITPKEIAMCLPVIRKAATSNVQVSVDHNKVVAIDGWRPRPLAEVEREVILRTLEFCKGNKARAAEVLGVDVKTIFNKLNEYGLPTDTYKNSDSEQA